MVNGGIINISSKIIPPPDGSNLQTMEGLIQAMPIMEPKHFIMPFLAHALGTFVGAILCSLVARSQKLILALSIGLTFFIGGFMMVFQLPAPLWFDLVDLIFAYFPMAWLGIGLYLCLIGKSLFPRLTINNHKISLSICYYLVSYYLVSYYLVSYYLVSFCIFVLNYRNEARIIAVFIR